jgi:tetratricopeptide (TPR) repeat protein
MEPARIFIAHTSELARHPAQLPWVEAAREAVQRAQFIPDVMGDFGPDDTQPIELCLEKVRQCQAWVGIIAFRYGSLVDRTEVSYVEQEYAEARRRGLKIRVFLLSDGAPVPRAEDEPRYADRQRAFRARLEAEVTVKHVSTPEALRFEVFAALRNSDLPRWEPRFLNPPPPVIPSSLRDRRSERAGLLARLVSRQERVVALIGEPGIGKTALTSQLLTDLQKASGEGAFGVMDYQSGVGYLSVTGASVLDRLLSAVVPADEGTRIRRELDDLKASWYERVSHVLAALNEDVLLVLDQIEDLLDEQGRFRDRGLNRLIAELSQRQDHRVTLLLVSARIPHHDLLGDRRSARFRLDEPLPDGEALELLRELADTLPPTLDRDAARAVELAGGHPRSLELMVAACALDPRLTVEDLEDLGEGTHAARVRGLVDRVADRMSPGMLAVVRALLTLGLPSSAMAVHALLRPQLRLGQVQQLLDTLATVRFVRRVDDRHYYLATGDGASILSHWVAEDPDGEQRARFRERAAAHFSTEKPRQVRRIEDLARHLREIELRMELRQYADCVELMAELDDQFLRGWGQRYVLMPWRRQLEEWKPGEHYWRQNLSALAAGANELDEYDEAMRVLRRAWGSLPEEPHEEDRGDALVLLSQMGRTAWLDSRHRTAYQAYERELAAAKRWSQPVERAEAALGLGSCLQDVGRLSAASAYFDEAELALHGRAETEATLLRADVLLGRAVLARNRADYETAYALAEEAFTVAAEVGNATTRVKSRDSQAGVLLDQGHVDEAVTLAQDAAAWAAQTGLVDITRTAHATLAVACLRQRRMEDARRAAESAARFRGKRAMIGYVTLGLVHHREGNRSRAGDVFRAVVDLVRGLPDDEWRPYFVWDALGLAYTGLHLCSGASGAEEGAVGAYQRAYAMRGREAPGATRRAEVFLDALTEETEPELVQDILRAALGSEAQDARS